MKDIITLIIVFAIAGVAMVLYSRYKAKLIAQGRMVQRSGDFAEYAEIFTLRPLTDENLAAALSQVDFRKTLGCVLTGDTKNMLFDRMTGKFKAKLTCLEMNEQRTVYQFEFTAWKSQHGRPTESEVMNMLLTQIEKLFLGLDPNAQVSTRKLDFNTKRNWI